MQNELEQLIIKSTGASEVYKVDVIQGLWSGYGDIVRYGLVNCERKSVVVKHVHLPQSASQPKGWNSNISHMRKMKSYAVELEWYKRFSSRGNDACRMAKSLAFETFGDEVAIVLEDLDSAGYPGRRKNVGWKEFDLCLSWLANFHVQFYDVEPKGIWETGTYWHLDTRPEEFDALEDTLLKDAAFLIDQELEKAKFQTIVHGDAKLANFCFGGATQVAAVDFQYVGKGCGMKDVAYLVGSAFNEDESESKEAEILETYFLHFKEAVKNSQKNIDVQALEVEWRSLYRVAWADFHRFIKGWSPGHWKINSYSEKVAHQVARELLGV